MSMTPVLLNIITSVIYIDPNNHVAHIVKLDPCVRETYATNWSTFLSVIYII